MRKKYSLKWNNQIIRFIHLLALSTNESNNDFDAACVHFLFSWWCEQISVPKSISYFATNEARDFFQDKKNEKTKDGKFVEKPLANLISVVDDEKMNFQIQFIVILIQIDSLNKTKTFSK